MRGEMSVNTRAGNTPRRLVGFPMGFFMGHAFDAKLRILMGLAIGASVASPACAATLCVAVASVLSFSTYDTIAAAANDSTATVQVTCTPGAANPLTTSYTITVAGTGSGNDSVRSISSAGFRLYYQLYKDASRSTVWGNGSSSGAGVASSVTSTAVLVPASRTHTAYARMPPLQGVAPGSYLGTLLVTVDY
jgi:spore coat protein U-like protein